MKVKFWGVRGSISTPGPKTVRYGGNTTCLQINAGDTMIICDAGTGIRDCGMSLLSQMPLNVHLLITHTHWDHIQGFPFFIPVFVPGNKLQVYGPVHYEKTLQSVMALQMDYAYFPVSARELSADITYKDLREETFEIEDIKVISKYSNHPVTSLGYRFEHEGKIVVFSGDMEPYYNVFNQGADDSGLFDDEDDDEEMLEVENVVKEQNQKHVEFCRDADILIHDAQYMTDEYEEKYRGWGHYPIEGVLDLAVEANVKHVVLTHHDPLRIDEQLDEIFEKYTAQLKEKNPDILLSIAKEGLEIEA